MKKILFTLVYAVFLPTVIFSQGEISEITELQWNQDNETWEFFSRDNWDYNKSDQEVLHVREGESLSPYESYNHKSKKSIYNEQGKILQEEYFSAEQNGFSSGSERWSKSINDYSYNSENELVEYKTSSFSLTNPQGYINKYVYEKEETENRRSQKNIENLRGMIIGF